MPRLKRVRTHLPSGLLVPVTLLVAAMMGTLLLLNRVQAVEAANELTVVSDRSTCSGCDALAAQASGSRSAAIQVTPTTTTTATPTGTPEPTVTPSPTMTPLPPINVRIKFEGIVQSIDDTTDPQVWVINGLRVLVTSDTRINEEHGQAQVGAWVKVEAHLEPTSDGTAYTIVADEIEVKRSPGACFKVEFYGELTEITVDPASGRTIWVVGGHTVVITDQTQIKGTPAVGAIVKVEGCVQPDGTVVAVEVEVRRSPGQGGEEVEFRGPIVDMADGQWQVGRWIVLITSDTEITGDPPDIGDMAEVHGRLNDLGQVVAEEIEVKDLGRARNLHVRIEGYITELPSSNPNPGGTGTWKIQGIPIEVVTSTIVVGVPPAVGVWAVADVMVQASSTQQNNVTYMAIRIRTRRSHEPEDALKFQGVLESMNGDTWTVSGWNFIVTPDTELKKNPQVNDWVEVKASYANGTYTAREIEAKKAEGGGGHERPHSGVKIEGRVTEMKADTGRWTIEGIPVQITPMTIIDERDVAINVGTWVEVRAMSMPMPIPGSGYIALVVEAKEEAELSTGQLKFEGRLESQNDSTWVIGGWSFVVDGDTEVHGDPMIGSRVKVTATWNQSTNTYHADVIKAEEHHGP